MNPPSVPLPCDLVQSDDAVAQSWLRIIQTCAGDLAQPVRVTRAHGPAATPAGVTLHLPVDLAAAQHPVWCLACRLACFLPHARVSVLVHGEQAFGEPPAPFVRGGNDDTLAV